MVFFPVDNHHLKAEGPQAAEQAGGKPAAADRPSEDEAFQRRIALIARRFGLSARETEVLSLMAKGRNAAYIRDKLVLSPYTVKTHMYHVYTKLDIHTQQKVIDFVEAYVEDADSPVLPV
nr:helix-turn-helix transcriptional regulator [Gordonibacter massiliensis (ex Traore et al. 2017)]